VGIMARGLTPKQESFCKAYIETGNASEAYRRSYNAGNMKPETIHVKACELLKKGNVAVRMEQLQERAQKRHDVTVDSLTAELEEARLQAKADEKGASAAVSAVMGKAKLHGLLIDKNEHSGPDGGPIETKDITTHELGRRLAFALRKSAEAEEGGDSQDD